jgi:SPX domain protein involved in polyphosphate accumulation
MKFAKQLALRAIPAWSVDYIDYKSLKKQIAANRARCNGLLLLLLNDAFIHALTCSSSNIRGSAIGGGYEHHGGSI